MPEWLEDASANRHIKTYVKDFLDVSGNMYVRSNADYAWNAYGQVISGVYDNDGYVYFGITVDMDASGNTIIVGGNKEEDHGYNGAARVYKYDSDADIWYQHGPMLTPDSSVDSNFGWQGVFISDDGSIVAVNDYNSNSTTGSNTTVGKIYVFQYNSSTNTWDTYGSNQSELEGTSSTQELGHRGISMSGDGSTIAAAEKLNDHSIRIKRIINGSWTSIGDTGIAGINHARPSLNYDGSRVVFNDFTNEEVYVYDYSGSGTTWNQVGSAITNTGGNNTDSLTSINKEGNIIAIHEQTNQTVRIYQYDVNVTGSWKQLGSTLMDSYGSSGGFGEKMRLNAAGDMIIIGNRTNSSIQTYKYQNGDWDLIGNVIQDSDDTRYGRAVAISDDGTKIVGGGYLADLNGTNSGYVQAWQWSQKTYTNPILDVSGGVLTISAGQEHNPRGYLVSQLGADIAEYNDNGAGGNERSNTLFFSSDGTTLYIGHQLGYNKYSERTGTFRVMKYRNDGWYMIGSIVAPRESEVGVFQGTNGNTYYGSGGLSSDGTRAMGAWYDQDSSGSNASRGMIRVYDFINGDWVQVGGDIIGDSPGDLISGLMSGDGNTIYYASGVGGYKRIVTYNSSTNTWDLQTTITTGSGVSQLNYDGTIRVDRDTSTSGDYKITTHKYANGSWSQIGQDIKSYGVDNNEIYAPAMSKYGDYLILSEQSSFSSTGVAVVYKYSSEGDIWMQLGGNIQNPFSTDERYFVSTRKISADGKTIIVTDYLNYGIDSTGNSGGVAVYKYLDGNWTQIYLYYHGDTYNDQLGVGAAMCDNGELFAVSSGGSYFARTYQITNPPPIKIDKDGVSLDNLFTGNNVTLQCPTLKGVSGSTANYESFWGRNPGMGDWRTSFGDQNAGYLYINNAYNSNFDLLLTGMYSGGGGIHRRGYDLASRNGGGLNFQIRITQGNTNEDFSLGISTTAYTYRLNVAGAVYSASGYYSSDDRIKHNETPLTNALETIRKLQPRHYIKTVKMYEADHQLELDASGNPLDASGNPIPVSEYAREDGFIAQEVNEIPELKYTFKESPGDDAPHGLDYTSIFTTAVKALQELDALDGERQTKLSSLQARIEALENK